MKAIRRHTKLTSVFLTILMISIAVPFDSVLAVMIGTDVVLDSSRVKNARDEINRLLLREDVQNALMAHGIDPLEAKARIDSLTDAEVVQLADQIHEMPAGGDAGAVIITALLVILFMGIFILIDPRSWGYIDDFFD